MELKCASDLEKKDSTIDELRRQITAQQKLIEKLQKENQQCINFNKKLLIEKVSIFMVVYSWPQEQGGMGGNCPPSPIFCQPKKFKSIKTTYISVYRNMAKISS